MIDQGIELLLIGCHFTQQIALKFLFTVEIEVKNFKLINRLVKFGTAFKNKNH